MQFSKRNWVACEDALPSTSGYYIVSAKVSECGLTEKWLIGIAFWEDNTWLDNHKTFSRSFLEVSHWMPLPEVPVADCEFSKNDYRWRRENESK